MKKVSKVKILIFVAAVMSFIVIYAGHFLFAEKEIKQGKEQKPAKVVLPPVKYLHLSDKINGNNQKIHILEVNPADERVKIKPVLSHDSVFGFEKLSVMAARSNAYAAVNAGFFYEYGQPVGMVEIDGRLISKSTGQFPVFTVSRGKADLKEIDMELWLAYSMGRVKIDDINSSVKGGNAVIYTPEFGNSNRAKDKNITITIRNNIVENISEYIGAADIPGDGMLLTFYKPYSTDLSSMPIQQGDKVEFLISPDPGREAQAYECGSWILRNGEIVIGDRDPWIGVMTNRDPRTAIGIKKDGTVVLVTVDGRQPGYSIGLTGKELGEFLQQYGVVNATMLDGGASTEMVLKGRIVNRPSYKGTERPVAGGLIITVDE